MQTDTTLQWMHFSSDAKVHYCPQPRSGKTGKTNRTNGYSLGRGWSCQILKLRPNQCPGQGMGLNVRNKVKVLVTQSCLTLCDPVDCSPPGSSVHGIPQARILEWAAIYFFRDLPNPETEVRSLALQAESLPIEPPVWKSLSCVRLSATPWTIQSMEFSRPEYWRG